MNINEIKQVLKEHMWAEYGVAKDDPEFTDDVNLFDYGYLDSFGATTMVLFIEERFGFEVTKKDLMICPLSTINEIAALIYKRTGER